MTAAVGWRGRGDTCLFLLKRFFIIAIAHHGSSHMPAPKRSLVIIENDGLPQRLGQSKMFIHSSVQAFILPSL